MGEKGTISKMSVEGDLGVTLPAYNKDNKHQGNISHDKDHNTEFFSMQVRATYSKKLKVTISMQKTAPDTKQMAFAVQSLRHAKTLQYISSIVTFPFSVHLVQPETYHS